jgi:hypothetical protein
MEALPDVKPSLRRTGGKLQRLKNYAKLKSQKVFKGYFL